MNQEINNTLDKLIEHCKRFRPTQTEHGVTLGLLYHLKELLKQYKQKESNTQYLSEQIAIMKKP